jgi:hypothetical protein
MSHFFRVSIGEALRSAKSPKQRLTFQSNLLFPTPTLCADAQSLSHDPPSLPSRHFPALKVTHEHRPPTRPAYPVQRRKRRPARRRLRLFVCRWHVHAAGHVSGRARRGALGVDLEK